MRLIDADALYREYQEMVCNGIACHECKAVMADGTCKLDAFINNAPTIDAVSEWIPCEERLPSKGVAVLVNGTMYDAPPITISTDAPYYYEQGWINAWMPLPEPWEGADDEAD